MSDSPKRGQQLMLFGLPAHPPPAARPAVGPAPVDDRLRALAAHLPTGLRLGTSSWSFPGWAGIVYDRQASTTVLARHGLAAYAQHPLLRAVGLDRTYYAPISATDFAAYAAAVPDDFRFLVKAPELCTSALLPADRSGGTAASANRQPNKEADAQVGRHPEVRRQGRAEHNAFFLDAAYARDAICAPVAEGLGVKAGAIVFQFPPQSPALLGGPERFAERLYAFLATLPRGLVYAVELRTAGLLTLTYADALGSARACHCITVHPTMPPPAVQAELCDHPAAPLLVLRWMLGHGRAYQAARERYRPFDRLVDEDLPTRRGIAELCRRGAARGREVLVTINNKAEGSAPLSVIRLAELTADDGQWTA